MHSDLNIYLVIAALLILVAVFSTRFAGRFGVPALVVFVAIGLLAGSSGPGGIIFADYGLTYDIGMIALATIIYSGGLDTRFRVFRASLLPASLLSTVGVILTMVIVGLASVLFTPLSVVEGLLLGAVLAPTDAAAVFSVLKGRGLPNRVRGVLETESGTNDPVGIYLTIALTALIATGEVNGLELISGIVLQLVLGALFGVIFGKALIWVINHGRLDTAGLYPVLALVGGFFSYALSNLLSGNGFLTIYVVGLLLANNRLAFRRSIVDFVEAAAWGCQIVMFLLLGVLAFPDQLVGAIPAALLITLILTLVARPVAVWLIFYPLYKFTHHYHYSKQEQLLIMWAGLKGAVPITLAMLPLLSNLDQGQLIFNIVFIVVIVATTVQGLSIVPLAKRLGLTNPEPPQARFTLDLGGEAPPGSTIIDLFLEPEHRLVGHNLAEITIPEGLVVAAIYRQGKLVAPRGSTVFAAGDHVYVLSSGENSKINALLARNESLASITREATGA